MAQIVALLCLLTSISPVFGFESSNPNAIFSKTSKKLDSLSTSQVIITGKTTILTENKTFELGFFSTDGESSKWYLGIWYASSPTPTYVWVANRETPFNNIWSTNLEISEDGKLELKSSEDGVVWETSNTAKGKQIKLLEQGNLVLLSNENIIVWESFDYPSDTWLPGMNLTSQQWLTCWKSSNDPSPGKYSLRLKPPEYGEIELFFNGTRSYWSTGNWTGNAFSGVPQMTVEYIYKFHFEHPFTQTASFGYTETSLDNGVKPLTRFHVDFSGQLMQFTWTSQTENWNMFWSQPDNLCIVYGRCGNFGFCSTRSLSPCKCLVGFKPADAVGWDAGDFSDGCHRESNDLCSVNDGFEEIGAVIYDGAILLLFSESRSICERTCLNNCSCIGLYHNQRTNLCKNLYRSLLNLRNLTSESTSIDDLLYVRVPRGDLKKKSKKKISILVASISGFILISSLVIVTLLILRKRKIRRRNEEESVFQ